MTEWHQRPVAGIGLRAGGLALLAGAWGLGRILDAMVRGHGPADVTMGELLLGIILFACTCMGAALLFLGPHLFDKVQLSERWTPRPASTREAEPAPPDAGKDAAR